MTRWLFTLLLAASCCRSPASPGPDAAWREGRFVETAPGAPRDGGTLTVRLAIEPVGLTRLHDRFAEGTMSRITVGPVYETLAGRLATSWKRDGDTLSIALREGVTFHDGRPFTSADVKATLETVLNASNATAAFREELLALESIETPDAHTVVLRWRSPGVFAEVLVLSALPMLPAHALRGDWDTLPLHRAPIGTGPFRFERWEAGQSLSYVRADARAHLERVVFRFVKDEVAASAAWARGEFDVMTRIPPATWRAVESQPWAWTQYQRVRATQPSYAWLGFNQRLPQFRDAPTRRALTLLFPAPLVDQTVTLGLEPRSSCPYFTDESCAPEVSMPGFDPARARALLATAGWAPQADGVLARDGVRFSFAFLVPAQSVRMAKTLPLYLDTLKAAGIDARIETVDVSAYMSRVRPHDFEAIALSWFSRDALQDNFPLFHSSAREGGANYVGFSDAEVDRLLEQIRGTWDEAERHRLEREVHRRVAAEEAYLFLGRPPELFAFKRRVHGVRLAQGWPDLSSLWVEP